MTNAESLEQRPAGGGLPHVPRWFRRTVLMFPLLLAASAFASARAQSDTTLSTIGLFTYRDALLAGGIVVTTLLARQVDEQYSLRLQDSSTQANERLHRIAMVVRTTVAPGSYIIGTTMYLAGRAVKNDHLARLGLHGTEALLVGEAVGGVLKGLVGRQRPYVQPQNSHSYKFLRGFGGGDSFRSFPSGHTLGAFAVAAAVSSETSSWWPNTRWIIGPAIFGGAALTGASRMYDNKHWASDVVMGAGIGTFAGLKVVRYHDKYPNSRIDRWLLSGSITPTGDGGHSLHWSLFPTVSLGARSNAAGGSSR